MYQPNIYIADGANTRFNFNFFIIVKLNLKVKLQNTIETKELIYGTDYIVEEANDYNNGGWVVLNTAPAVGNKVIVYRETNITQEINMVNLQSLSPKNLTFIFDKLTAIEQELNDTIYRSFKFDFKTLSVIDQDKPLNEAIIQNLPPENTRKAVAVVLKQDISTGKWYLTTSMQDPDQQHTQATEIHLDLSNLLRQKRQ
jgi:hypothetical protein